MPLFSNCFQICLAKELSSTIRKSNEKILLNENKNSTKKHSHKNNKRNENDKKRRHKNKENKKLTKSKGDVKQLNINHNKNNHNNNNNNNNNNKNNSNNKKNIHHYHKKENSINQKINNKIESPPSQINPIQKMNSINNKKQESVTLIDEQWNVCHYKDNKNIIIDKVQVMQTVSIYNCENSTIIIDAEKFKSLQIQNCIKCNVLLKNLISAIEMIDSKKLKVQITGKCSSITIDKCIGVEIYLSKENEETEFTTALSAEMNIHIEGNNPDDDWKEITIPEQYQHVLDKGDLTTRVSDLYKF